MNRLLINNKKESHTELKQIQGNVFNIRCDKINLNFVCNRYLEFDYPQKWSNYEDGASFFEIDYRVINEYLLTKGIGDDEVVVAVFSNSDNDEEKYLVYDSQQESLIKENIFDIYEQIYYIFNKYGLQEELNPIDYTPVDIKDFNLSSN